jgi:tetratricopeptide (TPR) repeat protein
VPLQPAEKRVRALYQELVKATPDEPFAVNALLELAELHSQRSEFAAAIPLLRQAFDKEPPADLSARIRLRLGLCLAAQGDSRAALNHFEALAGDADNPQRVQGKYRSGEARFLRGEWEAAVKHLAPFRDEEAFQNQPGLSDPALLRLGVALGRLERWEPAREAFQRLLEKFPDSPSASQARYGVGWTLLRQKKFPEASEAFGTVLGAPPGELVVRARLALGVCQVEAGQHREAVATLLGVPGPVDVPEAAALALVEAAHVLTLLKEPAEAEKHLRRVLRDYPKTSWAAVARERLKPNEGERPAPHTLAGAVSLLAPELKQPLPQDPLGEQRSTDAGVFESQLEEACQAAVLARPLVLRPVPAPWVRLQLPDPFEHRCAVDVAPSPPEQLPPGGRLRLPKP